MRLSEYLERRNESEAEFASRIGRSRESVRRYCNGERIPDRETMPVIVAATDRSVMPNDFFVLEGPAAPAESAAA